MPESSPTIGVFDPVLPADATVPVHWGRLYGSASSIALTVAARRVDGPVLLVAADAREADRLHGELGFFAGTDLPVLKFPDWETLPYDVFSPHQDIVSERLDTLQALPALRRGIVIIALETLMQRLSPPAYVQGGAMRFSLGETLDPEDLRARLENASYRRVSQVFEHGEYAVRGSLIDLFPMGADTPFRLDFFDDTLDAIRTFDPETQRSIERLEEIRLLPGREIPFGADDISAFRQRYRRRFEGDPTEAQIYREVSEGIAPGGIEYYLPLFFDETATLFDYLPAGATVVSTDELGAAATAVWAGLTERWEQRRHDVSRPLLEPAEICIAPDDLLDRVGGHPRIEISRFEHVADGVNYATASPLNLKIDPRADDPASRLADILARDDLKVLFCAESTGRREALIDLLAERDARAPVFDSWHAFLESASPVGIAVGALEQGCLLEEPRLAVVVEEQILGGRGRQRQRRRADRDPEAIIRDLTDLHVGAPVVHETYGVGRYLGLSTLDVGGIRTEFLSLEYADEDKLYVPVQALHLITRYTGASPEHAPLHRLGTDQWNKARRRAAEKARDAAAELLDIYARRAARQGHAVEVDAAEYRRYAADFPFEETEDQASTIKAVMSDMSASRPMDRVVCGDVGFGKTEVALRAAFLAVQDGRQVALLVPTTLLAQQHEQTFRDRFADWPVAVESLSRFRTQAQARHVLDGLARGTVDIVIGTHKLLQDTVSFRQLGLVIIDEEHRFGVRHKEKLKALRASVDVLTLTATPIPRTLNMAIGGLRDLSLITTPPAQRHAVKTFVSEWNDGLIREAVLREIRRGGQVYFVHNSVQTIERMADQLSDLVPEASLRVGHGQMRERELEQVMLDFYHRRFNLLLCTTIIESGIDLPAANTIVIHRADKFGLAQLHQLRGRVGRSHHRAYAYLLTPPKRALTAEALKRLEAIESLEDLGSGFALATHDLEIRGAGELLGEGQSGQIQEIGFTLYTELLKRAVAALRSGVEPDLEKPLDHGPQVDLHVPALIPDYYMPDVHLRLILYKRIASAPDDEALRELKVEMIDRFGLLPEPVKTLFDVTAVKLMATPLGIRKINAGPAGGRIEFAADTRVEPLALIQLVQSDSRRYRLDGSDKLRFEAVMGTTERRLRAVTRLLERLRPDNV